jgi:SAM-dependent methyltransferase
MKLLTYLKYFFYLTVKWDIRIAWYIIKQEIKGEKKYGINTTGADELQSLEKKGIDIDHATIYMPVSYGLLEEIFEQTNTSAYQHFIDIGCGKGRALCIAAHYGFKKVTGIDFSKELCTTASSNLLTTRQKIPALQYTIINNDAFYFEIPSDADCIFLFNPFDDTIMSGVVTNIITSLMMHQRKMMVIYANPLCKELFIGAGFKELFSIKKLDYLEAAILTN